MHYFVTGATGFIGKRLVKQLLAHKGAVVYYLLRPQSQAKATALRKYWGASAARVVPLAGSCLCPIGCPPLPQSGSGSVPLGSEPSTRRL